MRKSSKVELGLLAALALSVSGCRSQQMQRCVDDGNVVFPEEYCSPTFTPRYRWAADPTGQRRCLDANSQPVSDIACNETIGHHYHWYYGGRGSYIPGTRAYEGSEVPASGAHYATSSEARGGSSGEGGHAGTSRGGFGHAGGEGSGGE